MQEISFVQEFKTNRENKFACTRRLYSVYGDEGTGMLYR